MVLSCRSAGLPTKYAFFTGGVSSLCTHVARCVVYFCWFYIFADPQSGMWVMSRCTRNDAKSSVLRCMSVHYPKTMVQQVLCVFPFWFDPCWDDSWSTKWKAGDSWWWYSSSALSPGIQHGRSTWLYSRACCLWRWCKIWIPFLCSLQLNMKIGLSACQQRCILAPVDILLSFAQGRGYPSLYKDLDRDS
jgi:hypothetical protein